jgi:hypothetical protein
MQSLAHRDPEGNHPTHYPAIGKQHHYAEAVRQLGQSRLRGFDRSEMHYAHQHPRGNKTFRLLFRTLTIRTALRSRKRCRGPEPH